MNKDELLAEWARRSKREGVTKVMRQSHPLEVTYAFSIEMEREIKDFIHARYGSLNGKTVLEIGCGIGRFTSWLASEAKSVTAVDMTAEMIRQAPKLSNVTYVLGDIATMRVKPHDLAFDVWTLMHIFDDFNVCMQKIAALCQTAFICEYTFAGTPVSKYSIIRKPSDYMLDGFSQVASQTITYVDDISTMSLQSKNSR